MGRSDMHKLSKYLLCGFIAISSFIGSTSHAQDKGEKLVFTSISVSARSQLKNFINNVQSASGTFEQSQVVLGWGAAEGQTLNTSDLQKGEFVFERPGKFAWIIKEPLEQQIVSDGSVLLQYDPDLLQVTERDVKKAIGTSPASILFGNSKIETSFKLENLPEKEGWIRARPKQSDSGMKYIDIHFIDGMPTELLIMDSFDKTTSIKFTSIKEGNPLGVSAFKLKDIPQNVDRVKL